MLRRGLMINEKQIKNFDLKILAHYQDEKNGSVYLVSFKPHNVYTGFMGGHTIGDLEHGFLKGELLIREDDFAVVALKYTFELKVDLLNRSLEESFHNGAWKADRLSKIMSNLLIFKHEYSYRKDSVTGKYFVETIKLDCNNTGYHVANHRNVQLYFQCDASSSGIEGVIE